MDSAAAPAKRALKDRLLERTSPVRQASRGQPYNYPPLWYCKSDGDIVSLPGDPQNRAYFEDKGYAVLRHEEIAEWENVLRPQWIEETREKASLISTIRRVGSKHPGVEIVDNLDDLSIDDLKEFLQELGKLTGAPVKVLAKRFGVEADRVPDDVGVPVRSGAELANKIARGAARAGS